MVRWPCSYFYIDFQRLKTERIKSKALEDITVQESIKIDIKSKEFKDLTTGADKKTIAKTIVKLWKHAHINRLVKKVQ